MWRSAEHKEIELLVHPDSFHLSFKVICTLRLEIENGIHLKLQNSNLWVTLLQDKIRGNGQKRTRLNSLKKEVQKQP